ncbi:potassium voltage-gated channel protein Shaw isoform X2 [Lingula anatina]|nr:potassium voltage-gated channel protein Shaw isoform X2 [Lingula anatina]|eukprot:XP_013420580.1 potassium voltage-gated channel protein Shaw isoform X2 [Lingula anatina]
MSAVMLLNGDPVHHLATARNGERSTETLRLNVGGVIHEVRWDTLKGKHGSILPHLDELKKHYRAEKDDYFFDRHPGIFESVLNYYRTGGLHVPITACGPAVKAELEFWGISEFEMEDCCWTTYSSYQERKESLAKFDSFLGKSPYKSRYRGDRVTTWQSARRRVWTDLENPGSSLFAKIYASISLLLVLMSIMVFVLDSHPFFHVSPGDPAWAFTLSFFGVGAESFHDITAHFEKSVNESGAESAKEHYEILHPALLLVDFTCASFFTFDLIMRFIFSPNKLHFFVYPLTIIDLLAIVPFYAELAIINSNPEAIFGKTVFDFINILKIARVFRIFRLTKSYTGMKVILYSLKESLAEITLTLIILLITMLICSTLMFYADNYNNEKSDFKNIPLTLWWSIVTLTTVGYGEFVPSSGLGYIVGAISAFFGVLCLALTVPIIVNNFMLYYSHSRTTLKAERKVDLIENKDAAEDLDSIDETTNVPRQQVVSSIRLRDFEETANHAAHSDQHSFMSHPTTLY